MNIQLINIKFHALHIEKIKEFIVLLVMICEKLKFLWFLRL